MKYIQVEDIIFTGKQHISWKDVEIYLRRYDGTATVNKEYGDIIRINSTFADEYTQSNYTKKLRGALAKVKANVAQVVPEMVESATNRRWVENKEQKHNKNAIKGWYRYDVFFMFPVKSEHEDERRFNYYQATIVVKINDSGMFLYDIINIKKEARTPADSK